MFWQGFSPSVRWSIALGLAAPVLSLTGCANMNHAQSGAVMGTALGTVAGAAIGGESGHAAGGALIGALTGAMAGTVIGDAGDAREERDMALAQRDGAILQAQYVTQQQQQQQALNNFDLIRLSQSGVGDDVIVNMINTRGGQFNLNTESIISLKSNGVSDRVILAAQTAPAVGTPAPSVVAPAPQPGVVVLQPQPTVIVEPAPPVMWGWGYHHHPYRGPRHRHGHGSHVDLFFGF
ncbi:glycine zipper family protein [Planctomicrobium sp. SH661]|uniref:glycine zipper family protein n=1 Tax=Planctomicrobium sp. SH661 TaxID=3448124 RepID=UPI003F5C963C